MQKQQQEGQPGFVVCAYLSLIHVVVPIFITAVLNHSDVYHPVGAKLSPQANINDSLGILRSAKSVPSCTFQTGIENGDESLLMDCNSTVISPRSAAVDMYDDADVAFLSEHEQLGSSFFELLVAKDDRSVADEVLAGRHPAIYGGSILLERSGYVESTPLNRLPSYGRYWMPFIGLLMVMDVYTVCCVQGGIINFRLGQTGYEFRPSSKPVRENVVAGEDSALPRSIPKKGNRSNDTIKD